MFTNNSQQNLAQELQDGTLKVSSTSDINIHGDQSISAKHNQNFLLIPLDVETIADEIEELRKHGSSNINIMFGRQKLGDESART